MATLLFAYESFLRNVNKFQVSSLGIPEFLHFFHSAREHYLAVRLDHLEEEGKIDDVLSDLYRKKTYEQPVPWTLDKPSDYYRMGLLTVSIVFTSCGKTVSERHKALRLTSDKEGFVLGNPYYAPSRERWYYRQIAGTLEITGDASVTLQGVELTYFPEQVLYTPQQVAAAAQTPFKTPHLLAICEKATSLFLENKESMRIRSQPVIQKTDML